MDQEDQQQADFDDRNQRIALERIRVLVEDGRAEKHHQVADDVDDQVDEQREAGHADEELHSDRRTEERARDGINVSCSCREAVRVTRQRGDVWHHSADALCGRDPRCPFTTDSW